MDIATLSADCANALIDAGIILPNTISFDLATSSFGCDSNDANRATYRLTTTRYLTNDDVRRLGDILSMHAVANALKGE